MKSLHSIAALVFMYCALPVWPAGAMLQETSASVRNVIRGGNLTVEASGDGFYALRSATISGNVLRSEVEADTAAGTLRSSLYPRHGSASAAFSDEFGTGHRMTVTHSGLAGTPDLVCEFRVYDGEPWGDIRVSIRNTTERPIEVNAIRVVKSAGDAVVNLNGPASEDRVLSDSFSEDTPQLRLMDLGEAEKGIHRAFGSQLVYNRKSGQSFFMGALAADRFLTVFHLNSSESANARLLSFDVEDTGTNEALREQSSHYPAANTVPFRLSLAAGETISSERLMFAIGPDYHQQLDNYGRAIRMLHKALVSTPTPIGWWSWTALYFGVTEDTVLTNAEWLAQNLAPFGYRYFHVDEGYQFARGEYATPDGKAFPRGMAYVGDRVNRMGLTFGLWAAPFEVSERSWVYEHHRDWLVHNMAGEPIHIGRIGEKDDQLYALDATNPGAQEYLRTTYRTLVRDWGARYLKLDFMDAAAVEGVRFRPNTTALEALRIGLQIIRETVGDDVVLDKDGSPMLTPMGLVNTGRISQDTGHTFGSTRDAAPGIAARYYMNRNFFVSDPDAFTVSTQTVGDRGWHGNRISLTLDEAEASIALSAVSGGMFEIGDDLPTLGASPERVALVRNRDLLDMARLGRASVPIDLMSYRPEDKQPSVFLLKEDARQWILTVFNWTDVPSSRAIALNDLGLKPGANWTATDVLRGGAAAIENGAVAIVLPPHSVRMIKLIDNSIPEAVPAFTVQAPGSGHAGVHVEFHAEAASGDAPVLAYHWDFGDGVSAEDADATHAFMQAGQYTVTDTATGLNGITAKRTVGITVTGTVPTSYNKAAKERYQEPQHGAGL